MYICNTRKEKKLQTDGRSYIKSQIYTMQQDTTI